MKAANEFYLVLLLIISVLGLLGVNFLCIGAALYAKEKRKRASCTQQVIASVTDIQHRAIGASGYTDADEVKMMSWFPVYEYSVHGTVLRKRASVGTVRPEVSVGQKVNLYVNPNHPDEFYSPADKSAFVRKVFIGVGALCVSVALVLGVVLCMK